MNRCNFTEDATIDLREIFEYIARDDLESAKRVIDRIHEVCNLLPSQPQMGRDRSKLIPGMRSIVVFPYTVYYRSTRAGIEILRVLHGRRDIRQIIKK